MLFFVAPCVFWICPKGLFAFVPLDLNFTNPKSKNFLKKSFSFTPIRFKSFREKNSRSLTIPALIRYCIVLSIIRISTRPERQRQVLNRSPWRFSSAVHDRVHLAQGLALAPLSSLTPSSVLIIVLIRRQGTLHYHISHQHHEVLIWKLCRPITQLPHLLRKRVERLRGVRQEVLWLPQLLHGLQKRQDPLGGPPFQ